MSDEGPISRDPEIISAIETTSNGGLEAPNSGVPASSSTMPHPNENSNHTISSEIKSALEGYLAYMDGSFSLFDYTEDMRTSMRQLDSEISLLHNARILMADFVAQHDTLLLHKDEFITSVKEIKISLHLAMARAEFVSVYCSDTFSNQRLIIPQLSLQLTVEQTALKSVYAVMIDELRIKEEKTEKILGILAREDVSAEVLTSISVSRSQVEQ